MDLIGCFWTRRGPKRIKNGKKRMRGEVRTEKGLQEFSEDSFKKNVGVLVGSDQISIIDLVLETIFLFTPTCIPDAIHSA